MSYRTKLKREEGRGWIAEIIDAAGTTVCTTTYWDKKAMAEEDAEFIIEDRIYKDMARKRRIKKEYIDRILEDAERAHAGEGTECVRIANLVARDHRAQFAG